MVERLVAVADVHLPLPLSVALAAAVPAKHHAAVAKLHAPRDGAAGWLVACATLLLLQAVRCADEDCVTHSCQLLGLGPPWAAQPPLQPELLPCSLALAGCTLGLAMPCAAPSCA